MTKAINPTIQEQLQFAKDQLSYYKSQVASLRVKLQVEREAKAAEKVASAEAKRAAAIVKAEARLAKLLSKQVGAVGAKAVKANKRPSKGVVFGAEANELAAKIKAGVSTI